MPPALNTQQSATMNGDSSDSGDLILSFSVSSVEIKELEVLEVESCLETVELYQFEPLASDSSAVALPLAFEPSPAPVHPRSPTSSQPHMRHRSLCRCSHPSR